MPAAKRKTKQDPAIRAEAARVLEEQHENMAPQIQRIPIIERRRIGPDEFTTIEHRGPLVDADKWRDPHDDLRTKEPKTVNGFRRADVLRSLHMRSGIITREHLEAARLLSEDYEIGHEGARPGYERPEVSIGGAAAGPSEIQMQALRRYLDAIHIVGIRLSAVMIPIVLRNEQIAVVAVRAGLSDEVTKGVLVAALDRLSEHYEGRRKPRSE